MKPRDARSVTGDALHALRTRVVAAVRRGMTRADAARVVAAPRSAVNRWCQATGPDALRPRRRGRKPAGGPLSPNRDAPLAEATGPPGPEGRRVGRAARRAGPAVLPAAVPPGAEPD